MSITNPVLPGFHPDPSILRVGEDYYIATSTFQWFPGVRIHHSRDLVHWRPLTYALASTRLLNLDGVPDSGGVWAPCLSHDGHRFHLVYSIVRTIQGPFRDVRNFLITAADIHGPWSDPIPLGGGGFDASLFHDTDGRKYLLRQTWDHRPGRNPFAGIALQEYDPAGRALAGPVHDIFRGTALGLVEAPHLYRFRGWYFLITAEGGTGYEHAVTVARSRNLLGPYEADPVPLLTAWQRPDLVLQKAGHGSLVQTPGGEWYLAHLCARPLAALGPCPLGRETALQKCRITEDGWIRLESGGNHPRRRVPAPLSESHPWEEPSPMYSSGIPVGTPPQAYGYQPWVDGSSREWPDCSLRAPVDASWCAPADPTGRALRLRGRASLTSRDGVSLLARRVQAFRLEAEVTLACRPATFQHMAGLCFYYDSANWVYLRVTHEEGLGPCVGIDACDRGRFATLASVAIPALGGSEAGEDIRLGGKLDRDTLSFFVAGSDGVWRALGEPYPSGKLSDEYVEGMGFTGTMVGIAAIDLLGRGWTAEFSGFRYTEEAAGGYASEGAATGSEIPSRNSGLR